MKILLYCFFFLFTSIDLNRFKIYVETILLNILLMFFCLKLLFFVNSFIFCLYQVTWTKTESLLFRGDATQIFKILIMNFMLLEIVVFCQFIHILLVSGSIEKI